MRKKIFATMIVAVVAAFAGYNVYQSQNTNTLSDLALANVEALANNESGGVDCCDTCKGAYCGVFYPAGSMTGYSVYYKI